MLVFFVINGLKVAHHYFIHDRYESFACQCVGCLSFFCKYPVDVITECLDNYCIFVEDAG